MNMKRVVVYLCLFILMLSGCFPNPRAAQKEKQAQKLFFQRLEEIYADVFLYQAELRCGGKLYVANTELEENEKLYVFDSDTYHLELLWVDCWMEGKEVVSKVFIYNWAGMQINTESTNHTEVPIFWKPDTYGTQGVEVEYNPNFANFFYINGRLGREVIVIVTPACTEELRPYSECAEFGIEPYDSLNSAPIKILDDTPGKAYNELWHYGYPVWVFAVPDSKIDDSYELHFGDYVLTGKDIKSGTWSPGN